MNKGTFTTHSKVIVTREYICIITKDVHWKNTTRRFDALIVNGPLNFTVSFLARSCYDASFLKNKQDILYEKCQRSCCLNSLTGRIDEN